MNRTKRENSKRVQIWIWNPLDLGFHYAKHYRDIVAMELTMVAKSRLAMGWGAERDRKRGIRGKMEGNRYLLEK